MSYLYNHSNVAIIYKTGTPFYPPTLNEDTRFFELRSPATHRIFGKQQLYLELNFKIIPPEGYICIFRIKDSLSHRGLKVLNPIHLDPTRDFDLVLLNESFVPYRLIEGTTIGLLLFVHNHIPEIRVINDRLP